MGSGPSDNKKKEQITINRRRDDECRRISIPNVQNILLIWLDNNIDENNEDCQHTITQLRLVVHSIHTFVDDDQCIEFIQGITNTKACLIVSGSLGQNIVLRVHDMSQIDSIFIFCSNKTRHSRWIKKWPKIKGIFTDIKRICDALKKTAQQCEQNASSISFIDPSQSTTPFASIRKISTIQKENEVLFSMHTVFRIHKIQSIRANKHLYKVNLALTSDQDQDLCVLTEQIRQESFPKATGWYRLGLVLDDMGQFDKAAEIYEILLNQSSNENTRAPIYGQLGSIKCKQGKYSEALVFYEKALTIYQKTHPSVAQQSLPSNHPHLQMYRNQLENIKKKL
ncbi:hypothetical protein I4U23_025520 [Adineta vaga]|nr:hypothetical protein I4U23_025520 [Adineta vaga]